MMSAHWTCWLWMVLGAGLLGWGIKGVVLGTLMDDKRREMERLTSKVAMLTKLANQPPEVRTVEKRVEVPVERVVVKHVEVPVEKVVDRPVDNPEHLARIKVLEGEVAVIAGLFTQIAQLKTLFSQTGERRTEGQVVVPVDNPDQLERIKALEEEVAVITELRAQIAELQAASSPAGEKVVEKHIEPPAKRNGEMLSDKMREHTEDLNRAGAVAPLAEGQAVDESPDDLKLIRGVGPALERFLHKRGVLWFSQVATWSHKDIDKFEFLLPNFGGRIQRENWVRSAQIEHYKKYQQWLGDGEPPNESLEFPTQIAELRAASSAAGERVAEKGTETLTEKNGAGSVDMISEPAGNLDQADVIELSDEGQAVGESADDLKQIRGVGPGLERFLHKRGVFWFSQVATWSQADIDKFEFLLPNFGGRIQRENWVRSAQMEHYKKYKKWLGDDQPSITTPDTP